MRGVKSATIISATVLPGSPVVRTLGIAMLLALVVGTAPATLPAGDDRPQPRSATVADGSEAASPAGLLRQLADLDPDRRSAARAGLLSLRRAQLPDLRRAVAEATAAGALTSSQVTVLREVVLHVYLADEPYPADLTWSGFLGITLNRTVPLRQDTPQPADAARGPARDPAVLDDQAAGPIGIVVEDLWPGLASMRYLEIGDVLTGVGDLRELRSREEFSAAVRKFRAGETVVLHLTRRGRTLALPVVLSARPQSAQRNEGGANEIFRAERDARAEEYWDENFAPVVETDPPAPGSAAPAASTRPG